MPALAVLRTHCSALAFSIAALAVAIAAGWIFRGMHAAEPIVAGPGVTSERMLGAIEPSLAGGPGDTPVFELAGGKPGAQIQGRSLLPLLAGKRTGWRRSEERRVGKECAGLCRSRWSPYH